MRPLSSRLPADRQSSRQISSLPSMQKSGCETGGMDQLSVEMVMIYLTLLIPALIMLRVLWLWLAYKPYSLDRLVEGEDGWEWKR